MRLKGSNALHSSCVSIHASVKDATTIFSGNIAKARVSIHASVKDATTRHTRDSAANEVSIHASVKDATCQNTYRFFQLQSFNPRICKRCDKSDNIQLLGNICFNPRICKRCDALALRLRQIMQVSIHASVKDATLMMLVFFLIAT